MLYIENPCVDAAYNLALEQYLFDTMQEDFFMFWRNANAVIVGLHQNTAEEVNSAYIRENNIKVARRLSGGGAVYHDLGNLNFTIVRSAAGSNIDDFMSPCMPILNALNALGVTAAASGRNDITVDGKKISGNARYLRSNRLMHHGTILFDTDISEMALALNISGDKFVSKGIKSISARVTNVREHLSADMPMPEFMEFMRKHVMKELDLTSYSPVERDAAAVEEIRRDRYDSWDWNYGKSPEYTVEKRRSVDGFGTITVRLQIDGGVITSFAASGDYFGNKSSARFAELIRNTKLEEMPLLRRLDEMPFEDFFEGITRREFAQILLS